MVALSEKDFRTAKTVQAMKKFENSELTNRISDPSLFQYKTDHIFPVFS